MNNRQDQSGWKRMSFKGNKVWAQIDDTGNFLCENNKVLIKYNLNQDYEYRVHPESLKPEDQAVPSAKKTGANKSSSSTHLDKKPPQTGNALPADIPDNSILIYTDGASSGNPGPAGIGALLIWGEHRKKISEYIGHATNNIAELTAIKRALSELKRHNLPVRIFSDSSYSIGLLAKGWKPKSNEKLVAEIKKLMKKFDDLAFIKVKGHAGIKENEVADYLATSAIKKGPS